MLHDQSQENMLDCMIWIEQVISRHSADSSLLIGYFDCFPSLSFPPLLLLLISIVHFFLPQEIT